MSTERSTNSPAAHPWKGRVAFVSGAASGIGFGLARVLASRGVRVAMSDVRREALDSACARLAAEGADVAPFVLDVADRAAFYATADAVEQRFGKVHYVFNNAGVGEVGTPLDQVPDRVFDWVIDVNLRGVFNGIKAFVPKLRRHGEGGHVVNVSSMAALVPDPGWHQGVYAATKMAVTALSLDLRLALAGTGIEVSILYPGLVRTDIAANVGALRPVAYDMPPETPALLAAADMPPETAAEIVLRGMERRAPLIVTHPLMWPVVAQFHDQVRAAFEAAP
ncbi:SDR family NAD(P)-dependent oxidoreductase [Variovorax sp. LjRoot130]|uniref:SDR family NAD(P)-dependent oxidoreductase n=1 Tax=Variovorax sp. LjRoot130 TaxID=3342261 RepID=UPI003ED15B7B